MIYFIQSERADPIKIGYSQNKKTVYERLRHHLLNRINQPRYLACNGTLAGN